MPKISITFTGKVKTIISVIEDKDGDHQTIDIKQGAANPTVKGGGLAWITVVAKGDPGDTVEIKLANATGGAIKPDHTYTFDTRGTISRSFQFNPDA